MFKIIKVHYPNCLPTMGGHVWPEPCKHYDCPGNNPIEFIVSWK